MPDSRPEFPGDRIGFSKTQHWNFDSARQDTEHHDDQGKCKDYFSILCSDSMQFMNAPYFRGGKRSWFVSIIHPLLRGGIPQNIGMGCAELP